MQDRIGKSSMIRAVIALLVLAGIVGGMVWLSKSPNSPAGSQHILETIDAKKTTLLQLTASSAAAATVLAAVPSDATTPVASEIADLASFFSIALAALYIEKLIVLLSGTDLFFVVLCAAAMGMVLGVFLDAGWLKSWMTKLMILGIVLFLVVPVSAWVSDTAERALDSTFETTVDEAQAVIDEAGENTDADGNFLTKAWEKVTGGVSAITKKGEDLLNRLLDTIAQLLIVTCGIPIAVLFMMTWLLKSLFGMQIRWPAHLPGRKRDRNAKALAPLDEHGDQNA